MSKANELEDRGILQDVGESADDEPLDERVETIEVVSAVIMRQPQDEQPRMLLTQRLPTQDYPMTWECPGGKVAPRDVEQGCGEEHDGLPMYLVWALRREIREEVGLSVFSTRSDPVWQGEIELYRGKTVAFAGYSEGPVGQPGQVQVQHHGASKPWRRCKLTFLRVNAYQGAALAREGQGFGWCTREQVHGIFLSMGLTPGNSKAHEAIMAEAFGPSARLR